MLASVPPALYEIGTALVVAVTVFPQLAESARRVRAAQALRGGATSGVGRLQRFLVPVLEDALERSLSLAAGMDTRGYGRAGGADRPPSAGSPARCMLPGLTGICVGHVRLLDHTAPAGPGAARCSAWAWSLAVVGLRSAPAGGCSAPATGPTRGAAAETGSRSGSASPSRCSGC